MIVVNEALLDVYRAKRACEWCGRSLVYQAHPHHFLTKGIGGGSRLDVDINLISLCPGCHESHHRGNEPTSPDLLAVIAAREGMLQDQVLNDLWELRRADGDAADYPRLWEGAAGAPNQRRALRPTVPGLPPRRREPGVEADEGGGGWHAF